MPADIAAKVEIPPWAGLVTFRPWRDKALINSMYREAPGIYTKAPILHKVKASDELSQHAMGVFYFRYWNIRRGQPEEETPIIQEILTP